MMNQAFHIDAIKYMASLPDNAFDLAIADPPQGDGTATRIAQKSGKVYGKLKIPRGIYPASKWDKKRLPKIFFQELFRVSRHQVIWCGEYYSDILPSGTQWIHWDKLRKGDYKRFEHAWTSFDGPDKTFTYLWNGHQQGRSIKNGHIQRGDKRTNDKRIHPTQKPIHLYEWILQEYAQPNWKVLDPTLGSGSSRIAAFNLGFDFVGLEKDSEHFRDQEVRWSREVLGRSLSLFVT